MNARLNAALKRVGDYAKASTDVAIAAALGVSRSNVATWKRRGYFPHDVFVAFANKHGLNLNWLLDGNGERTLPMAALSEEAVSHLGVRRDQHKHVDDPRWPTAINEAPHASYAARYSSARFLVDEVLAMTGFEPEAVLYEGLKALAAQGCTVEQLTLLINGIEQHLAAKDRENRPTKE